MNKRKRLFIHFMGNSVQEVVQIGENEFVSPSNIIKTNKFFEKREEALYENVIKEIKKGKSINNYKKSKYYTYYIERLKKEYPEFII